MYVYYTIAVFDVVVGVATVWFVIKCRFCTAFPLCIVYEFRCIYLWLGWSETCRIFDADVFREKHAHIVNYFISYSLMAFIMLLLIAGFELLSQLKEYKIKNATLQVNGIRVNVDGFNGIFVEEANH